MARQKAYSHAAKMAEFDAYPRWARNLANEYGQNVVRGLIADGRDEAAEMCAMIRANRQRDLLRRFAVTGRYRVERVAGVTGGSHSQQR